MFFTVVAFILAECVMLNFVMRGMNNNEKILDRCVVDNDLKSDR